MNGSSPAPCLEPRTFNVWFDQVNQCRIEVKATDENQAIEKAYRVWRRDYATNQCSYVEEVPNEEDDS